MTLTGRDCFTAFAMTMVADFSIVKLMHDSIVINVHNISAVNHGLSKTGSGYPGKPQPPGRPRDDDRETRGKPKATPRRAVHSVIAGNKVRKQSLVSHGVGLLRCARDDDRETRGKSQDTPLGNG